MSIDNDEKTKHIETIFKSIDWLVENDLWDEVKEIMRHSVMEAAHSVTKKLRSSKGKCPDFKERNVYPDNWHEIIKDGLIKERE
jgi:hypothetical protein